MVHSKSAKSHVFSYKCTHPTFVLVRRLYQSDVCTSPTFVLVRHLNCLTFVLSNVCASYVCILVPQAPWLEQAGAEIDFGSCRLGNCTFGKLPLGKIHLTLQKNPLGKYLTSFNAIHPIQVA